ncbi:MAG: response regulator transcription factor [Sphingomonas sp.]|uniref:response regulator transcription factor n=1 Tax=Sphingomonas sp. TaxID=28214 RepID=UPI001ACD433D|nr:response regulator transcription factor [Sphingomonas sp.]MBN8808709.1 response regulator transcription factor [Sphingomonas sp.]
MARIIIVDDDELFGDIACDALSEAGHSVSAVTDGEGAMRAIAAGEPDLLILDYNLPGMSGLEVLRQTRRERPAGELPIMMLTREDGRLLKARAGHDGASDYLVKPCRADDLVARVEALLRRRRAPA